MATGSSVDNGVSDNEEQVLVSLLVGSPSEFMWGRMKEAIPLAVLTLAP